MTNSTRTIRHRYAYERADGHRIELIAVGDGDGDEVHVRCGYACIGDTETALLRWADELRKFGHPEMADRVAQPKRVTLEELPDPTCEQPIYKFDYVDMAQVELMVLGTEILAAVTRGEFWSGEDLAACRQSWTDKLRGFGNPEVAQRVAQASPRELLAVAKELHRGSNRRIVDDPKKARQLRAYERMCRCAAAVARRLRRPRARRSRRVVARIAGTSASTGDPDPEPPTTRRYLGCEVAP